MSMPTLFLSAFLTYLSFSILLPQKKQQTDLESEAANYVKNNQASIARAGASYARNNPESARAMASAAAGAYV